MNELALFAGVGGGILGGTLCGFRTICAVEIDPYCREILLRRQRDKVLPLFPVWDEIKTFNGQQWRGVVDIITAGFPCQPFSVAGKQEGENDARNMWPDTIRIIREVGPRFAFMENVPGLLVHPYFGTILGDLAEIGYDCQWSCLGADDVGANHRRKRLWILAYPRLLGQAEHEKQTARIEQLCETMSVPNAERLQRQDVRKEKFGETPIGLSSKCSWWAVEPRLGRVAHGVANRVDRLKAIGNGQVPLAMAVAFHKLYERINK